MRRLSRGMGAVRAALHDQGVVLSLLDGRCTESAQRSRMRVVADMKPMAIGGSK